jgi:charged multivesicular body protein 5
MNRIFGKKKAVTTDDAKDIPNIGDAATKLDGRVVDLDKKIAALNTELATYKDQIKKSRGSAQMGYKKRAMAVLKRKKMLEKQRDSLSSQAFNIGNVAFSIESAKTTVETVQAMKVAKQTLSVAYTDIDIDDVEELHEDLADLMLDTEEINEVMGRSYDVSDDVDESDLMVELAALEDEWEDETIAEPMGETPTLLPSAPTNEIKTPNGTSQVPVDEYGLPAS